MSAKTAISWTDYSSNPVKYIDNETGKTVWACVKKSAGCANCYAEALALRWGKGRGHERNGPLVAGDLCRVLADRSALR